MAGRKRAHSTSRVSNEVAASTLAENSALQKWQDCTRLAVPRDPAISASSLGSRLDGLAVCSLHRVHRKVMKMRSSCVVQDGPSTHTAREPSSMPFHCRDHCHCAHATWSDGLQASQIRSILERESGHCVQSCANGGPCRRMHHAFRQHCTGFTTSSERTHLDSLGHWTRYETAEVSLGENDAVALEPFAWLCSDLNAPTANASSPHGQD